MSDWNKDFDFSEFSVNIIKVVDSIRSDGKNGSTKSIEPRINALYRAIGLPAVNSGVDNYNNGNIHTNLILTDEQKNALNLRKNSMNQKVNTNEIEKFLDINDNNVSDSIIKNNKRTRGKLKPMVIDNSIPIWPVYKRVTQVFSTEEKSEKMDTKFKRPLLETIISMKLKMENTHNTDIQERVKFTMSSAVQQLGVEIRMILEDSLKNVGDLIDMTIKKVGNVRSYMSKNVLAKEDGIPEENLRVVQKEDVGVIEQQVKDQEQILMQKEARLAIFNFDDTFISNSSQSTSRNLKSALLASDVINIITASPASNIRQNIKESKTRIKKYESDLKNAHKDLDLVFGTYSGLSGSDVLAIIKALFDVKLGVLVSLLNDTGKNQLKKWAGLNELNFSNMTSVNEAITILEKAVENNLNIIQEELKKKKHKEKIK